MAHQKITYALILFLAGSVLLSCKKKLSKEDTTVEWVVINPVTNTPYVGVPVKLFLEYYGSSSGIKGELLFEGITNSQGRVSFTFKAYEHHHYGYWGEINWGNFGSQGIDYAILKQPGNSVYTIKKNELNELRYEIVPYVEAVYHKKNFNCQGEDDVMRFRQKSIFSGSSLWSNWTPEHVLNVGCVDELSQLFTTPMDYIVTEIEVTRQDGSIEHFIDTSYINSYGSVDTIKVYY